MNNILEDQDLIYFVVFLNSHKLKMSIKLRTDYASVLHMPILKENFREKDSPNTGDLYGHKQYPANQG